MMCEPRLEVKAGMDPVQIKRDYGDDLLLHGGINAVLWDDVEAKIKAEFGRSPVRTEGLREQQWTLIDYGDVVVHVFLESVREFYEIERLYMESPKVAWEAPGPESLNA